MKLLILIFSLIPHLLFSQEIFEDAGKQIVSTIKDIEVTDMLKKTREFQECRDLYPFNAGDSEKQRTAAIQKAQECFKKKLSDKTDTKKLEELSKALNLQQYGLVKSKSIQDLQVYLNNKMYEAMTGIKVEEEDQKKLIDSMKFKNKKHIDQRVFITLYKNQVSKNAIYEVSRFCFENLRIKNKINPPTNFAEYWKDFKDNFANPDLLTDTGIPQFGTLQDGSDKNKIYEDIFASINISKFPTNLLSEFFSGCGALINKMCEEFKEVKAEVDVVDTKSKISSTPTRGAAACLSKSRLQEYRKALTDADKIEKVFDDIEVMSASEYDQKMAAILTGSPKIFGTDKEDTSLDNLTNYTSKDFLEGTREEDDKYKDCEQNPDIDNCNQFLSQGDQLKKIQHKIEVEMTLKREIEMARVREELKKNGTGLEDYLKENGFFGILEKYKAGNLSEDELVIAVGEEFEAKKVATLEEINKRMGKRQVSDSADKEEIERSAKEVIQQSREERARLAQVVLFNNIISSHIELTRRHANGESSEAGRNINAWIKEEEDLKKAKIDPSLFSNLKVNEDKNSGVKGIGQNDQFGGIELIEKLLGKD